MIFISHPFRVYLGNWREVLNTNITPNEGYINTTMDGECIVQCQRPEIWRIFEMFKENIIWKEDHLLVDVHLTTFNGTPSSQQELVIKVMHPISKEKEI